MTSMWAMLAAMVAVFVAIIGFTKMITSRGPNEYRVGMVIFSIALLTAMGIVCLSK